MSGCNGKEHMISSSMEMSVEVWLHISSFLPPNDVKSLSLVNIGFNYTCQSRLWHTINLSKATNDSVWSDSLGKLRAFCMLLETNRSIAGRVRKLIMPSEYDSRTDKVHLRFAENIMSGLRNVSHIVIVKTQSMRMNMDAVNVLLDQLSSQPRTHRPGRAPFHTPSMVLCLPAKVRVLEGMFPDPETAKAFLSAQSLSLKIWKGHNRQEIPFFIEKGFTTPSLTSLGIINTDHYYEEIRRSTVLQASIRALQIRDTFNPEVIFPTMRSFPALESLSIQMPSYPSSEINKYLIEMATALPQLRRLSLNSTKTLTFDVIPTMPYLEHLVMFVSENFTRSKPDAGTEFFGALEPLRERCPQLVRIDVFPFLIGLGSRFRMTRKRQRGWEVRFLASGVNEAVWQMTSLELEDLWAV